MIGSLFSGIGGLELGLERAGLGPVAWQVEFDPFCRRILAKHWPSANRSVIDVKQAGAHNLPRVDLICGGFPCQDVSSAGKGAGLAVGTRSGLWFEFRRIVAELFPPVVVVENVASGKSRWLPQVRRDLYLLGYDTAAYAISAADVGAPHLRQRTFVVAHPHPFVGGARYGFQQRDEGQIRRGDDSERPAVAWSLPYSDRRRMADGVPRTLDRDRLKALGNSVVPQCAEVIGRIVAARAWPDPLTGAA